MIDKFQNQGLVTNGTVSYIPGDSEDIQVDFTDANGNNRTNFIRSKQYPSSLIGELEVGQSVSVRYLLPEYEYDLIWETHFDLARAYLGYAYQPGVMILVCLIIIVIHPEFLFIFYMNDPSNGGEVS